MKFDQYPTCGHKERVSYTTGPATPKFITVEFRELADFYRKNKISLEHEDDDDPPPHPLPSK